LRCPSWSYLLQNLHLVEPIAEHYLNGSEPHIDRDRQTDELLHFLSVQKMARVKQVTEIEVSQSDTALSAPQPAGNSTIKRKPDGPVVDRHNTAVARAQRKRRKLSQRDKMAVAAEQKWRCGWCESLLEDGFETDHIEEFHETGNDHYENLWAICANCHNRKTELDRRRKKPHIWANYRPLTAEKREQRRRQILAKITKL